MGKHCYTNFLHRLNSWQPFTPTVGDPPHKVIDEVVHLPAPPGPPNDFQYHNKRRHWVWHWGKYHLKGSQLNKKVHTIILPFLSPKDVKKIFKNQFKSVYREGWLEWSNLCIAGRFSNVCLAERIHFLYFCFFYFGFWGFFLSLKYVSLIDSLPK